MNNNSTVQDFLLSVERGLHIQDIKHKEHFILFCLIVISFFLINIACKLWSTVSIKEFLKGVLFSVLDKIVGIRNQVDKEMIKFRQDIHKTKETTIHPIYEKITKLSDKQIEDRISKVIEIDDVNAKLGKEGGNYYYNYHDGHRQFVSNLASNFLYTNIMHFDSCKGSQLMENELVSFFRKLLNGPREAVGTVTIGGTESIFLTMLTMREHGIKIGLTDPEVIMFESAHIAFRKASFYLKLKIKYVKINESGEGKVDDLLKEINDQTVGIVLSGGTYANGVVDQIPEVSRRIRGMGLLFHVDSCLGGFMTSISHFKKDGKLPICDFTNTSVTSISIDPHKYGESPKGCSILMFRNEELKKLGLFGYPHWNGGLYVTPSFAGSRGVASIVGAWISLMRFGMEGLVESYDKITKARDDLVKDLKEIKEIEIVGPAEACVVSFKVKKGVGFTIFSLHECLNRLKWSIGLMQKPVSFHITITKGNIANLPNLKNDIRKAMEECRKVGDIGKKSMYSNLYGSLVKIPNEGLIYDCLKISMIEINKLKHD